MMIDEKGDKVIRVLQLYAKLADGYIINKSEEALNYGVNERSIQRDIDDIRNFLDADAERTGMENTVIYDREQKGYRLEALYHMRLTNSEVLALCKTLLDSRAFAKNEIVNMLDKLINCGVPKKNQKMIKGLIANEEFHYIEPHHGKKLVDTIWDLGQVVTSHRFLRLEYEKTNGEITKADVKPVGIMCSEYYWYLIAYVGNSDKKYTGHPTIYRIDRIQRYKAQKETFAIPYRDRFEEGEFRKHIPFMYSGELYRETFIYKGPDINAVLDRLPTATATKQKDGSYKVHVEVFGRIGLEMWKRSQGENVMEV